MDFVYPDEKEVADYNAPPSVFPVRIETENLIFEAVPFCSLNLYELYELYTNEAFEEISETIPVEKHQTPRETHTFINKASERFEEDDGVSYIIHEKPTKELCLETAVGVTGGHIDWDLYEWSCYIWLLPEARDNGYSKERGEMFLSLAFDELSLETVRVSVLEDNIPSKKAIEGYICENGGQKEGLKRNGVMMPEGLRDIVNYSITKSEWEENNK